MKFAINLLLVPCAFFGVDAAASPGSEAIDGWGPFKLGMAYEEAIKAAPQARWNPASLEMCEQDMAVKGCVISQSGDDSYRVRIEGIPWEPVLRINKFGIMDGVILSYANDSGIKREECLDLYERTLDRLARELGPFAFPDDDGKSEWPIEKRRTPAGNAYAISVEKGTRFWIARPIRGQLDDVRLPTAIPITRWNNLPYVSISAHYLDVSVIDCHVAIDYSSTGS